MGWFTANEMTAVGRPDRPRRPVPYDNVLLGLMATDDTVDATLLNTVRPITLTYEISFGGFGVEFWAECGSLPNASHYAVRRTHTGGYSREIVELGACASNWHVTWTNVGSAPHIIRVAVGAHFANTLHDVATLQVGVTTSLTTAQRAELRDTLNHAAWRFFGATGGNYLLRSFNVRQSVSCRTSPNTACGGGHCDVCLDLSCLMPWGLPGAFVDPPNNLLVMCGSTFAGDSTNIIGHELGHLLLGLADEYTQPASNPHSGCAQSMMSQTADFENRLCGHHRATTEDSRWSTPPSAIPPNTVLRQSILGPTSFWVGGGSGSTAGGTTAWDWLWSSGRVTYAYPMPAAWTQATTVGHLPDNQHFAGFFGGSFNLGQVTGI